MRNDLFLKEMGAKIKAVRKAKKISLRELERLTDIDMSNLCRIENGKKNSHILTLKSIADVLEMDIKHFI